MERLRRLWRKDKALAALLLAVPIIILAGLGWNWFDQPPGSNARPATYRIELTEIWRGSPNSEPTEGMRFLASKYGTVTDAPVVRAEMVDGRVGRGTLSLMVHEDVAAFVRAAPNAILLDGGVRAGYTTLDLRPEHFAQGGRLILREGCLRVRKDGWEEERLVVPMANTDLFRDPEGYLAAGSFDAAAEYRLRVGEPGGLLWLSPVADAQLEGVEAFRELCGDAPIVLLAQTPKRLPDCSPAFLAQFVEQRRAYEAAFEAQKEEALACRSRNEQRNLADSARGGPVMPPTPCPPMMQPPPPPQTIGGEVCRHPDVPVVEPQPSQGSSTQPNPSR